MANKHYTFIQNYNNGAVRQLSMTGILKPLSIGTITSIAKQDPIFLRRKIGGQLNRIKLLEINLTKQFNDPKYLKVQQKNKIDLNFLKDAEKIHRNYFEKVLYYREKTSNPNLVYLNKLQISYKNALFTLNQNYQRVKLELKGVLNNENPIRDNVQFQQI